MAALLDAVNRLLASGEHKHILSVIKGFRNGAVYGAKIRFPHALVMTFLFRNGSLKDKILAIFEATYTHSRNLALFVFAFKGLTSTLSWGESKSHQLHAFLSAFCAGFVIFGKYNKVNEQINLYLMSRVIYGLAKLFVQKKIVPEPKTNVFPWFAAIMWGLTLWLFEYQQACLQPSLVASMTYIYKDSEKWTSLRDFLLYNE
ncbi:peroxisomal membrane protein 4 [Biomphalaria pfeifferi]|uniref:Peroxisomal membrane protein 4 n=1 Tax=Biomphalaria pfeifferi TaxID=112525 RepID=A0AAD8AX65_BIOPF|nr:peroxisomal membrane protein 4 [Biomphalaria pfeifferi]